MMAPPNGCIVTHEDPSRVENPDNRDTRAREKIQSPPFSIPSAGLWSHAFTSRARVSRFSLFQGNGPCNRPGTDGEPFRGAAEYQVAIDELRRLYLADRLPGETAAAWLRRTGRARGWFGEAEPLPTDPDSTGRAPAKGSRHGA